jgi:hypothetical protein
MFIYLIKKCMQIKNNVTENKIFIIKNKYFLIVSTCVFFNQKNLIKNIYIFLKQYF